MSYCCNISAGENVYIEQKDDNFIIHCSPIPAPQSNIHTGFFQFNNTPEKDNPLAACISNCIFKVNGRYYKIDDYKIYSYYAEKELIYLKIDKNAPERSFIVRETVYSDSEDADNPQHRHLDDGRYILLYITNVKNERLRVESYGAGSLIDTVLLPEGFVFALDDGMLYSTVSKTGWGELHEFSDRSCIYVSGFDPVARKGINIEVDISGGVLWMDKYDKFVWNTTGFTHSISANVSVTSNSVWLN